MSALSASVFSRAAKLRFMAWAVNSLPVTMGYFLSGPWILQSEWGLVEKGHAVAVAEEVGGRVRGRLDAVEGGPEPVVAPRHEEVAAARR